MSHIILFGPPGTGKTELAKAIAKEIKAKFFNVKVSTILSSWQGETEKFVDELFNQAKKNHPSIIFLDEMDGLLAPTKGDRGEDGTAQRIINTFQSRLEGFENNGKDDFCVIGTTNVPWLLTPPMRDRFALKIYIELPAANIIEQMIVKFLKTIKNNDKALNEKVDFFAKQLHGYSGREVKRILDKVLIQPFEEYVNATHFIVHLDNKKKTYIPCELNHPDAIASSWKELGLDKDDSKMQRRDISVKDFEEVLRVHQPKKVNENNKKFEAYMQEVDGVRGSSHVKKE